MRRMDWSQSPLGPVADWPRSLKTAVRIMLTSRQPMFVWWGEALINLYNDAYRSILGGKHPGALGQPASVVWREIWDQVAPRAKYAMTRNEGTYDEALLFIMERYGYQEETYYTFSYSPVPDDEGGPGGILCANSDDTQRIIGGRQLGLLRELATRTADARTIQAACRLSAASLKVNSRDLPFALIYLLEPDGETFMLAGATGIARGHDAAPDVVSIDCQSVWPLAELARTGVPSIACDLGPEFGTLPSGAWQKPPTRAVVLPIPASGKSGLAGALVAGLNPYRLLDDGYEGFLHLVAGQIAAAIGNAEAYEEAHMRVDALAELDRVKTAFFSNVSHELRTPLTLLLGPIEDALGKPESEQLLAGDDLDLLRRNGRRLLKLVNTLLDFSRLEAGRIQAVYEPVDLAVYTAELASMFHTAFARAGLYLTIDCPPLPEPAFVDRDMWEKVVLNLLSNAFKFTFSGGVTISVRPGPGHVELRVTDTGVGIGKEELPRIFERFHRIASTKSRTHEGAGIGLALVSELVRLHGGEVTAESAAGKGSSFIVRIPLGSAHLPTERIAGSRTEAHAEADASAYVDEALRWLPGAGDATPSEITDLTLSENAGLTGSPAAPGRLLIADDNADIRFYLTRLLAPKYDVETVSNGTEALERVRARMPDLLLTDVMMPGLDGFGLLQALRADPETLSLPVILLSARAGEESRVEGLEAGADDYLIKPFSARELIARVDGLIELTRVRKAAEETKQAGEARFRRLFHTNIFAMSFANFDGRVIDANDAYLNLIGYSREELAAGAIRWANLTPPEYRDLDLRAQQTLREIGLCEPYEKEYVRKDGTRVPILLGSSFLEGPFETQDSCVTFVLDLTQQKRIAEQLRQTQKLESLGVLAGGLAHDFNNLLVGIIGNASLALDATPAESPNFALLQGVLHAGERAAHLTKQMLAYAGKGRFVVGLIDLSALIREIITLIQASIPKNVGLRLDLEDCLPQIEADITQMHQLVMNLIINGAEAIEESNGTVQVTTSVEEIPPEHGRIDAGGRGPGRSELAPGRYVLLRVRDDGCGMDEATKSRIFDPFFTTKFMGRGLGLAAVQGIVRGHKGAINVSSAPGAGTTFDVYLPAHEAARRTREEAAVRKDLAGSGLALVVDDEELVRRVARLGLERYGYTVMTAENGQEAVDLFRQHRDRISVVILDMAMPVMGGDEALTHIRSIDPDARVVLTSGYSEDEAVGHFVNKRFAGFIQKPYTSSQLAEKIKSVLNP
jgi:PAS domain S-box-containing protein